MRGVGVVCEVEDNFLCVGPRASLKDFELKWGLIWEGAMLV